MFSPSIDEQQHLWYTKGVKFLSTHLLYIESEGATVKALYEKPYTLILQFRANDVITTSGPDDFENDPFDDLEG